MSCAVIKNTMHFGVFSKPKTYTIKNYTLGIITPSWIQLGTLVYTISPFFLLLFCVTYLV